MRVRAKGSPCPHQGCKAKLLAAQREVVEARREVHFQPSIPCATRQCFVAAFLQGAHALQAQEAQRRGDASAGQLEGYSEELEILRLELQVPDLS
jgi:hypothetical protein